MRIIRNIALFCFSALFLWPIASFGQVKPLATGDIITRTSLVAQQIGNGPVTFAPKESITLEVLIEDNGDRKFFESQGFGKPVYYANDKFFTDIIWRDKRIPQNLRFVRFPPGGKLEPSMQWDVPPYYTKSCGSTKAASVLNYKATSENGPDVIITIDGKDTTVTTIRIFYEGWLPTCNPGFTWKKTHEVLYSPELNELISTKVVEWYMATMFMEGGGGWAITSIKTGDKK